MKQPGNSPMSQPAAVAAHKPGVAHEVHHETLGFWRKYLFSTDHKVIGIHPPSPPSCFSSAAFR